MGLVLQIFGHPTKNIGTTFWHGDGAIQKVRITKITLNPSGRETEKHCYPQPVAPPLFPGFYWYFSWEKKVEIEHFCLGSQLNTGTTAGFYMNPAFHLIPVQFPGSAGFTTQLKQDAVQVRLNILPWC